LRPVGRDVSRLTLKTFKVKVKEFSRLILKKKTKEEFHRVLRTSNIYLF
jgi:hypothetical protein